MYKMIALDIDDTLLDDELRVSDGTKEALAAAEARGVTVTLATGRMYASARKVALQLGLNVPIITYQGALVKTLLEEDVLYERYVPRDAVDRVFDYCESRGLHLQLYYDDILYTKEDNDKVRDYVALSKIPYTVEPNMRFLLDKPLTKLLIIDKPEYLDEIAPEWRGMLGDGVHITKSKPHYLEVMHKEGTKGHALQALARHFGCAMSEVIAVGDAWNDKEMLEMAGLGVAMGNAIDALKEIADYVTLTNNEDGVKHVIDKFVLNRTS